MDVDHQRLFDVIDKLREQVSDLCERITQAGGKIIYTPRAIVNHIAHKERLTKKYFTKRLFVDGVMTARKDVGKTPKLRMIRLIFYHRTSTSKRNIL